MTPVEHQVLVACPIDHAFEVFTRNVDTWWPPSHRKLGEAPLELEPRVGGLLRQRSPTGDEWVLGEVVAWEPPLRLQLAWRLGGPPDSPTLATVTFTPVQHKTLVHVVHTEGPRPLPDWARTASIFDRSWQAVLTALSDHLAAAPLPDTQRDPS